MYACISYVVKNYEIPVGTRTHNRALRFMLQIPEHRILYRIRAVPKPIYHNIHIYIDVIFF